MQHGARALVLGEVLWDRFPDSARLGGAPLNFAVHLSRLGHNPILVSAVGADEAGDEARRAIGRLGLQTDLLQVTRRFATGSATVCVGPSGHTTFAIERPAAYDAVDLPDDAIRKIAERRPSWIYYGTLFSSHPEGRRLLDRLLAALPWAERIYDLNLRPGFDSPDLVADLLEASHVVKLNDEELTSVARVTDLPSDVATFLREATCRYGWRAACVTRGARGCAMLIGGEYAEADAAPAEVVDTVGAGDAFAAAFVHGLVSGWPVQRVAEFCNATAAGIVAVQGAIPDA